MSFHRKVLTLVDRLHLFFMAAGQILSFDGRDPSRLWVASLIRSRFGLVFLFMVGGCDLWMREYAIFWVSLHSWAPLLNSSGWLMKRMFLGLTFCAPFVARL